MWTPEALAIVLAALLGACTLLSSDCSDWLAGWLSYSVCWLVAVHACSTCMLAGYSEA